MLTTFQCVTMEGWTPIMYWVRTVPLSNPFLPFPCFRQMTPSEVPSTGKLLGRHLIRLTFLFQGIFYTSHCDRFIFHAQFGVGCSQWVSYTYYLANVIVRTHSVHDRATLEEVNYYFV